MSNSRIELLKAKYLNNIPLNKDEIKYIKSYPNDEKSVIINALKTSYSMSHKRVMV